MALPWYTEGFERVHRARGLRPPRSAGGRAIAHRSEPAPDAPIDGERPAYIMKAPISKTKDCKANH